MLAGASSCGRTTYVNKDIKDFGGSQQKNVYESSIGACYNKERFHRDCRRISLFLTRGILNGRK